MSQFSFDASEQDFAERVLEASYRQPVLVDFWAPWCGPCRSLKPLLEKLAEEYGGRFLLARVDSDSQPRLSAHFGVRSIPTVKAFVGGEVIDEFTGALPERELRAFIDRVLPSPADGLRAEALALYDAGDADGALSRLYEAIRLVPADGGLRLDAVELLLALGRSDEARAMLDGEFPDDPDRAAALRAKLALAGAGGDADGLEARLAADPDDHPARIGLARALAASGHFPQALDHLLESLRRDRAHGDGIARQTMLEIFSAMSSDPGLDDLIRDYRRKLATLLN